MNVSMVIIRIAHIMMCSLLYFQKKSLEKEPIYAQIQMTHSVSLPAINCNTARIY